MSDVCRSVAKQAECKIRRILDFKLSESCFLVAAALLYLLILWFHLFPKLDVFSSYYLGNPNYGAYQNTLWWYTYITEDFFNFRSWFYTDLQKYPFGFQPYIHYANDLLAALLFWPFNVIFPLNQAVNSFVLFILLLNAICTCILIRSLACSRLAAFASGLFFILNPFIIQQIIYGRFSYIILFTFPLFLLCWIRAFDLKQKRYLVLSILLLVLTFLFYTYYGVFLSLMALVVPFILTSSRSGYWRNVLVLWGCTFAIVLLPMLPLLLSYGDLTQYQDLSQAYAPMVKDLPPTFGAMFNDSLTIYNWRDYLLNLLGIVAIFGLLGPRKIRLLSTFCIVGVLLALGPYLIGNDQGKFASVSAMPLPFWLFYLLVPGGKLFAHPIRFLVVTFFFGALILGLLITAISAWLRNNYPNHTAWKPLVCLAVVFLLTDNMIPHNSPPIVPRGLKLIGDGKSPMILLPLQVSDFLIYPQIFHRRPMLNGDAMFIKYRNNAPFNQLINNNSFIRYLISLYTSKLNQSTFTQKSLQLLRKKGFTHIVLCKYVNKNKWIGVSAFVDHCAGDRCDFLGAHLKAKERLSVIFDDPVYEDNELVAFSIR